MCALKEVGACRIFLPHCGNDHDERTSGQGVCRNHSYGYMVTGSITAGSQNAASRSVSQSALSYQTFSANTKPFAEKCEFM